jgi:hypothetical protein
MLNGIFASVLLAPLATATDDLAQRGAGSNFFVEAGNY